MAERGGFVYIDPVQSEVLYQEFLTRVGETEPGTFNGGRLQSGADRCLQMAQQERGDIVRLTAHLIIQMVRDKDRTFSKRPLGASMALVLAWLHRNGYGLAMETEELVAATRAIAAGGVYLEDLDQYLRQYMRQAG